MEKSENIHTNNNNKNDEGSKKMSTCRLNCLQMPGKLLVNKVYICFCSFKMHIWTDLNWSSSVQFSSVAQSCPTLCDPMNCSTPGLPVQLLNAKQLCSELPVTGGMQEEAGQTLVGMLQRAVILEPFLFLSVINTFTQSRSTKWLLNLSIPVYPQTLPWVKSPFPSS